jgi:hypothetical protein
MIMLLAHGIIDHDGVAGHDNPAVFHHWIDIPNQVSADLVQGGCGLTDEREKEGGRVPHVLLHFHIIDI